VVAQDHSIERVWATLELGWGKPQSIERVEVLEIETTPPSMRASVSQVVPSRGSTMRGNLPGLGMMSGWPIWSKVIKDSEQRRYSGLAMLTELIAQPMSLNLRPNTWGAGLP
jgi:hypothetical protein